VQSSRWLDRRRLGLGLRAALAGARGSRSSDHKSRDDGWNRCRSSTRPTTISPASTRRRAGNAGTAARSPMNRGACTRGAGGYRTRLSTSISTDPSGLSVLCAASPPTCPISLPYVLFIAATLVFYSRSARRYDDRSITAAFRLAARSRWLLWARGLGPAERCLFDAALFGMETLSIARRPVAAGLLLGAPRYRRISGCCCDRS